MSKHPDKGRKGPAEDVPHAGTHVPMRIPDGFADWLGDCAFMIAVERRDGKWYALIMDFDITNVGATQREAIQSAVESMTEYLIAYFEDGVSYEATLRPVPRRMRTRIRAEAAIGHLVRRIAGSHINIASEATYTVPPAMLPCFAS